MNNKVDLAKNRIKSILNKIPNENSKHKILKRNLEFLENSENYLKNKEHTIAFIGNVGIGKTTAISKLLGLVDEDGETLLQTGSGRTTICEVEIRKSDKTEILIEPYDDEEIKRYLYEFTEQIKNKYSGRYSDDEIGIENKEFKIEISKEIERAIRNMTQLKSKRITKNGKRIRIDEAVNAYEKIQDEKIFYNELLDRINLPMRVKTKLDPNILDEEKWIKETFKEINVGLKKDVTIPKKIIIYLNTKLINKYGIDDLNISFIDTKGIDETANRKDIERQLMDIRTISVLCTGFNDAPDKSVREIIRYMVNSGLKKYISKRIMILVLDRNNEASQLVELDEPDTEEGREIRKEQIVDILKNEFGINDELSVEFFDSFNDPPEKINNLIYNKIINMRAEHESQIISIIDSIDHIEKAANEELSAKALNDINENISVWIKEARKIKYYLKKNFLSISDTIRSKSTHVSSVRASVNRNGEWHNLDYYKILSDNLRQEVVNKFDKHIDNLRYLISTMREQDKFSYQMGLLISLQNTLDARIEKIYSKAYNLGAEPYLKLKYEGDFWKTMRNEWGRGSGYKNRIIEHTNRWFEEQDYNTYDQENAELINKLWNDLINEIEGLICNK